MKLKSAQVQNFGSIVDSTLVQIEEGVTILIGKNEQGKTNFLRGLASFNEDYTYSPGDLPNHLRPSLENSSPETIPIVSLWFVLEPEDMEKYKEVILRVESVQELKCQRNFGGNYNYSCLGDDGKEVPLQFAVPDISRYVDKISAQSEDLKTKLVEHGNRVPPFVGNKEKIDQITNGLVSAQFEDMQKIPNIIKTFSTSLKGLPHQDEMIQEDIAEATKEIEGGRQ